AERDRRRSRWSFLPDRASRANGAVERSQPARRLTSHSIATLRARLASPGAANWRRYGETLHSSCAGARAQSPPLQRRRGHNGSTAQVRVTPFGEALELDVRLDELSALLAAVCEVMRIQDRGAIDGRYAARPPARLFFTVAAHDPCYALKLAAHR